MMTLFSAVALVAVFYLGMVIAVKNGYTVEQLMNPLKQLEDWLNKTFKGEEPPKTGKKK